MTRKPNLSKNIGLAVGPTQDLDSKIRSTLAEIIHFHPSKKREQIASEMSELLGRRITVSMINDFTAASKETSRFPAAWVPAFCIVTGDDRLQRLILSPYLTSVLALGESELDRVREEKKRATLRDRLLACEPEGADE